MPNPRKKFNPEKPSRRSSSPEPDKRKEQRDKKSTSSYSSKKSKGDYDESEKISRHESSSSKYKKQTSPDKPYRRSSALNSDKRKVHRSEKSASPRPERKPKGDYYESEKFTRHESPSPKYKRVSDTRRPKKKFSKSKTDKHTIKTDKTDFSNFRLNKYLAHAGVASRREADELIKQGAVTVNGEVVREMGYKVKESDVVKFKDKAVRPEKKVYILMNKPKDYITTTEDERGRKTVMELIKGATEMRIYPVGRLDRKTTGLLVLTNDGELAQKLTHPSHKAKKVYQASLDKPLTKDDMQKIAEGIKLEEGIALVDGIAYTDPRDKSKIGIEIHIGWNKVVRRIFEHLGYQVEQLDRMYFAGLTKKDLPRGKWRFLKDKEIIMLKHFT